MQNCVALHSWLFTICIMMQGRVTQTNELKSHLFGWKLVGWAFAWGAGAWLFALGLFLFVRRRLRLANYWPLLFFLLLGFQYAPQVGNHFGWALQPKTQTVQSIAIHTFTVKGNWKLAKHEIMCTWSAQVSPLVTIQWYPSIYVQPQAKYAAVSQNIKPHGKK